MKCRMILAASAAGSLLILAGCVTVPQSDLAQAVKAAIQPAVDTFFEALEEGQEANHPTGYLLRETGRVEGDNFIDWGYWSGKDDETLFEAALYIIKNPPQCPPNAECLGPGVYTFVSGTPTGTNPVSGSAIWNGFARAVFGYEVQLTGKASLWANLRNATVDVYLSEMDYLHDHVWRDLDMVDGTFSREEGDWMISGAFYGDGHEGVAGHFNHEPGVVGVFGALRE